MFIIVNGVVLMTMRLMLYRKLAKEDAAYGMFGIVWE